MDRFWIKTELLKNQTLNKTFINHYENHFICWLYMENKKFYITDLNTKLNAIISPRVRLKPKPLNNKKSCIKISIKKYLFSSQLKYKFVYIEELEVKCNKLIDFNEINFCSTSTKNSPHPSKESYSVNIKDFTAAKKSITGDKKLATYSEPEPEEITYKKFRSPSKFWADDGFIINEEFDTPRKPHTPIKEIEETFDLNLQKTKFKKNGDKISTQLDEIPISFNEITQISMISQLSNTCIPIKNPSTAKQNLKEPLHLVREDNSSITKCFESYQPEINNQDDQSYSSSSMKSNQTHNSPLELKKRSKSSIEILKINKFCRNKNYEPENEFSLDLNQLTSQNIIDDSENKESQKIDSTFWDSQQPELTKKKISIDFRKKKLMMKTNKASDDFYQTDVEISKIEREKIVEPMKRIDNKEFQEFSNTKIFTSPLKSDLFISKERLIQNEQRAKSEKKQSSLKQVFSPINKKKPANMRCLLHQLNSSLSNDNVIGNIEKNVKLAINKIEQANRRKRLYDPCTYKVDEAFENDKKSHEYLPFQQKSRSILIINETVVPKFDDPLLLNDNKSLERKNEVPIKSEQYFFEKNLKIYKESVLPSPNLSNNSDNETILSHKFTINANNLQSYLISIDNLAQK